MTKPLFSETSKAYLSRFLDGEMPHPATPFEARAILERAAANTDPNDHGERLVKASFLLWADDVDPQPTASNHTAH